MSAILIRVKDSTIVVENRPTWLRMFAPRVRAPSHGERWARSQGLAKRLLTQVPWHVPALRS